MSRSPLVLGKAGGGVRPGPEARGHDARLALRQSAHGGERTASTHDRRRRRTWPGSTASPARTRTPTRCAASSGPSGRRRRAARPEDRARAGEGGPETRVVDRTSTPGRHDARGARPAQAPSRSRDDDHRRQRLGHQRRRGRATAGLRGRDRALRPRAAGPRHRDGERRRRAAHDGHRPGARHPEAPGAGGRARSPTTRSSRSTRRSPRRCSPAREPSGCPTTPSS